MQNTPLRRKTRHCGLSYLMWRRVVNVICMLHWCSNCIFFFPQRCLQLARTVIVWLACKQVYQMISALAQFDFFFGWDALFFFFFFLDKRQPAYIDPSPGPSSHHHHPPLVCRFLDSESVVLFGPCDFHDHGITHRYEELTFIWLEFCFWEKQDAFV